MLEKLEWLTYEFGEPVMFTICAFLIVGLVFKLVKMAER